MIKNKLIFENFNQVYAEQKQYSYAERLHIWEALFKEARLLGRIPLKNPLEGLDACLRIAGILNSIKYKL
jgi:hypothetical protein